MAITASKFMELNRRDVMLVSNHALEKIKGQVGSNITCGDVAEAFMGARMIRPEEMIVLGYRPRYWGRKARGEKSWYFRFVFRGWEFIAVLRQKGRGEIIWVTTYVRNHQNEALCILQYHEIYSTN